MVHWKHWSSFPHKVCKRFTSYESASRFSCSKCGKLSKVHDGHYRVWRHLDICDYSCYLNIKMPRTSCPEHGMLVLDKHPFGRQNTHYSFQLEVLIMTKAKNVSIRTLSIELREPDSNIWGTIHRYIKQGVQKTDCSKNNKFWRWWEVIPKRVKVCFHIYRPWYRESNWCLWRTRSKRFQPMLSEIIRSLAEPPTTSSRSAWTCPKATWVDQRFISVVQKLYLINSI